MHRTFAQTPILGALFRLLSQAFLRMAGWRPEGGTLEARKAVIIAAPHTSNWDFLYLITLCAVLHADIYWMGKDTLFRWPFGRITKWFGGIPIDRSRANNVAAQTIQTFNECDDLYIIIPAEGTREKVQYWKRGFYYIAHGAGIPIMLGFLDYGRKRGGFGKALIPTGDIQADMKIIREYYAPVQARHPENTAPPAVRPPNTAAAPKNAED